MIIPIKYLLKHWRGDYSLRVSFWLNYVLISVLLSLPLLLVGILGLNLIFSPQSLFIFTLCYMAFGYICYLWQFVGTYRACGNHISKTQKKVSASVVRIILLLGLLWTVFDLATSAPNLYQMFKLGTTQDRFSNYKFTELNNGRTILIKGTFGFGFYKDFQKFIDTNKNVEEVILSSGGGRMFEALKLSNYIRENNIDTYALNECYSACTVIFIAGKNRFLIDDAKLGFHAVDSELNKHSFTPIVFSTIQSKVAKQFKSQGVKEQFLREMYNTSSKDMWYPTTQELLSNNVVTNVCKAENIIS